jgi:phage FluMu protein Com
MGFFRRREETYRGAEMNDNTFCPYCEELVVFEFTGDYYFDNIEREVKCPNCHEIVMMTWGVSHEFYFNKRKDNDERGILKTK